LLFFGSFLGFFDLFYFFVLVGFTMVFFTVGGVYVLVGRFYIIDEISFVLIILRVWIYLFCLVSSGRESWSKNSSLRFVFFQSLILILLFLRFSVFSLFIFYVSFEFLFIFMFIFLLGWGYSPERRQASFYMVFYTLVVSFPLLVYLLLWGTSHRVFSVCWMEWRGYWLFFLFMVFLVKLPVFGLHLWLPKAHVEAPVAGSMLLAGVLLKLGGYGFLRFRKFSLSFLGSYDGFIFSIGLIGSLFAAFVCIRQVDLKAFIAYSSVCHMGMGLRGIYSRVEYGKLGAVFMLISHGLCSSCLFYMLYVFYERFYSRSLVILKGILHMVPVLGMWWFIFRASNIGVPPTLSFFSEVFIIIGVGTYDLFCYIFIGCVLFLAGVYRIYIYVSSMHGLRFLGGYTLEVSCRELLIIWGHFYPSLLISLGLGAMFWWSYSS